MPYAQTVPKVRDSINNTFEEIYPWFEQSPDALGYRPADKGWTIAEILEHITLTSHFLLIVATNGSAKALKRAQSHAIDDSESDLTKLVVIGTRGTFPWIRPEHMEPKGKALSEVLTTMRSQQEQCVQLLEKLKNGEGSLFKVTMSVNQLGRIDLYQWIYFIAQHAKRHIGQMRDNLDEWQNCG
jgi:DinB family protein